MQEEKDPPTIFSALSSKAARLLAGLFLQIKERDYYRISSAGLLKTCAGKGELVRNLARHSTAATSASMPLSYGRSCVAALDVPNAQLLDVPNAAYLAHRSKNLIGRPVQPHAMLDTCCLR